jgi:hypothetical protein
VRRWYRYAALQTDNVRQQVAFAQATGSRTAERLHRFRLGFWYKNASQCRSNIFPESKDGRAYLQDTTVNELNFHFTRTLDLALRTVVPSSCEQC